MLLCGDMHNVMRQATGFHLVLYCFCSVDVFVNIDVHLCYFVVSILLLTAHYDNVIMAFKNDLNFIFSLIDDCSTICMQCQLKARKSGKTRIRKRNTYKHVVVDMHQLQSLMTEINVGSCYCCCAKRITVLIGVGLRLFWYFAGYKKVWNRHQLAKML